MTPTDLHDPDLEARLRTLLHDRAATIDGPAPALRPAPALDAARLPTAPLPAGTDQRLGRRWLGAAAALLLVGAVAVGVAIRLDGGPDADQTVTAGSVPPDPADGATDPVVDLRVQVVNASNRSGVAGTLVRQIREAGYVTLPATNGPATSATSYVAFAGPEDEPAAAELARRLALDPAGIRALDDSITEAEAEDGLDGMPRADLVVVLGEDWTERDLLPSEGSPPTTIAVDGLPSTDTAPTAGDGPATAPTVEASERVLGDHHVWTAPDGVAEGSTADQITSFVEQVTGEAPERVVVAPGEGGFSSATVTLTGGVEVTVDVRQDPDGRVQVLQAEPSAGRSGANLAAGGLLGDPEPEPVRLLGTPSSSIVFPLIDGAASARVLLRSDARSGQAVLDRGQLEACRVELECLVELGGVERLYSLVVIQRDADGRIVDLAAGSFA